MADKSGASSSNERQASRSPSPGEQPHGSLMTTGVLRRRMQLMRERAEEIKPSLFGGFSSPGYLTESTCPTLREKKPPSRQRAASTYSQPSFHVSACNTGAGPGAFFDTIYPTLASPDQNDEANRILSRHGMRSRRQERSSEASVPARLRQPSSCRRMHSADFIMASYPKKPTGKGSYVGCFQQTPYEYLPNSYTAEQLQRRQRRRQRGRFSPPKVLQTRSVMTSPPKHGGFGVAGTTFSPFVSLESEDAIAKAIQKRSAKKQQQEMRKRQQEKAKSERERPVFKAVGGRHLTTFDEMPGTGASAVYNSVIVSRATSKHGRQRSSSQMSSNSSAHRSGWRNCRSAQSSHPPFRPASATRVGNEGFLNPFSNTVLTEADMKRLQKHERHIAKLSKQQQKEIQRHWTKGLPPWKAPPGPKTSVVPSLLPRPHNTSASSGPAPFMD